MNKKIALIFSLYFALIGPGYSQINEVDKPVKNFDTLWEIFAERYANFELKGVDWDTVYEKYRDSIDDKSTNRRLFEVCCTMLQELEDGHVSISPDFREEDIECGPPYDFSLELAFDTDEKIRQFASVMDTELRQNGFSKPIRKRVSEETNFHYRLSDSLTYLRLDEMTEQTTFGKFKRAIDEVISASQSKKGLIIDLRFNGGGLDYNAYQLARRFVPEGKTIGHFERKRRKGTNTYSPMKYRKLKPGGKQQFTGPIVILTSDYTASDYTASAAEVFVLVMRELPNVLIVGDHTEGIFSDMYEFKLPNKWMVSLSHQQYFSQEKENFEGRGIPPDVQIVNQSHDIDRKQDPVIQKAIELLKAAPNR